MVRAVNYKWYAVYVKSRAEKKALTELTFKGVDAYLPLRVVKRKWSDRVKLVEEPLLRGYLFVFVSEREYPTVLQTPGVVGYVTFEGKAAAIPEEEIENLKIFLERNKAFVDVSYENIAKGQQVKVVGGPLEGVEGEVFELRGKKRISLRFETLGCSVFADVSLELLEKIELINS